MRPRPLVGSILVGVGALVALSTIFVVGNLANSYGPTSGSWLDGAVFALQFGALGVVLAVVVSVLAIIFGRATWVRVAAAVVMAVSVLGLAAAGGSAAQARFASASKAPQCMDQGVAVPGEIQAAFDELEHPGWIDTLVIGVDGCASVVRNLSVSEVQDAYRDQLVDAGWTIEQDEDTRLVAARDGYRFIIWDCGEAWIAIEEETAQSTYC